MAETSEKLFGEVLADAQVQAEEIRRRAQRDVEDMKRRVAQEIRATSERLCSGAETQAATKRGEIQASVAVEVHRERLARIEQVLQNVRDGVERQLAALNDDDRWHSWISLTMEALAQLPAGEPLILLSLPEGAHGQTGPQLIEEILRQAPAALKRPVPLKLADRPAPIAAGVVLRTADGRIEIVNSLQERLRRLWPELRLQVAARLFPAEAQSKEK